MTDISRLTRGLTTGINADPTHGAVVPPLHLTSTFSFSGFGECGQYDYTRSGNPTRDLLGEALATLEGGFGGTITSTGMSAIALCTTALLAPGDTIVVPHDCYGGSWRLFDSLSTKGQFRCRTVDLTDPDALAEALRERPKVVWVETPSNPLLRLTDVRAVADAAHAAGALVVADNTFLSPLLQRPIELGADVVVHSTTKYINGHSDVVGGAVVAATPELHEELAYWGNVLGVTGSPFDSYLALRGLRTLHVRLRAHQDNARALVDAALDHPAVARVHYPGLADHPGHDIAARQQDGFGAMLSVELRGGEEAVRAFVDGLHCFTLAESLGGTESLVAHPATMTHASMSPEARAVAGIGDGLLRFSVGIEAPEDLVADLRAALDRAEARTPVAV
ncbi:cystathionine gamma-synthase [Barrientosiimonas humi]|uniref:Cystathionine gamma-synthase n=2 Tax=Barrientosiimonas TaxID=1535207 RepID=A0A542X879_9MICO|nr:MULTISPECIES: cystathionine gamma-synthase [Barrientosiimonas]TQL32019.1 cystathionine gamma-synthase [Barrientosiimonas humi]BDZ56735.1 cystathionine gamma-synthase [Barrientosiimonas endolithica]CAG7571928.1 Cystathionine gamma-synthase [Barrientosiimonas humi]